MITISTDQPIRMVTGSELVRTAPAIAAMTGLGAKTVYRLAEAGRIPVFRVGTGPRAQLVARRGDLIAWIDDLATNVSARRGAK